MALLSARRDLASFDRPISAQGWLVVAAGAAAGLLAVAHGFETFGHYPPCELCLHQREVYWVALWVAAVGLVVARRRPRVAPMFALLLGLIFLGETLLASYHAGVEWRWWPGPASCTGGHAAVSVADLSKLLRGPPVHMVRCDQAAWRLAGLSMAGWNALVAFTLVLGSLAASLGGASKRYRS